MRNAMMKAIVVLAGAGVLAGCSSIRDQRGYLVDTPLVDSVQPGIDNQQSVERTLGRPTFVSAFGQKDWYYVSSATRQAAFSTPKIREQLVLKVSFDAKGNVAAVERSGMERVVQLDPDGGKTPTLGKQRTFLEDLFGNIGTVGTGAGAPGGQGR